MLSARSATQLDRRQGSLRESNSQRHAVEAAQRSCSLRRWERQQAHAPAQSDVHEIEQPNATIAVSNTVWPYHRTSEYVSRSVPTRQHTAQAFTYAMRGVLGGGDDASAAFALSPTGR